MVLHLRNMSRCAKALLAGRHITARSIRDEPHRLRRRESSFSNPAQRYFFFLIEECVNHSSARFPTEKHAIPALARCGRTTGLSSPVPLASWGLRGLVAAARPRQAQAYQGCLGKIRPRLRLYFLIQTDRAFALTEDGQPQPGRQWPSQSLWPSRRLPLCSADPADLLLGIVQSTG